jgi:hypothetical protein
MVAAEIAGQREEDRFVDAMDEAAQQRDPPACREADSASVPLSRGLCLSSADETAVRSALRFGQA